MRGCGCGDAASASTQLSNVLSGSPGGGSGQASGGSAGPGGAAGRFLFSHARPVAAVFSPSGSGGRQSFLRSAFDRFFVSAACSSSRLPASLAEQPLQHGPSGTAPCEALVRGNVGEPPRARVRLRFTEERPQSTPRVRALRRLQDQVTDLRLEHALAHSCIRHIV